MAQDLYVFFLPRCSPHLNIAETFRRKAKYEWLRPSDYGSFAKFKTKVKHIFNGIGSEYKIAFSQMTIYANSVEVLSITQVVLPNRCFFVDLNFSLFEMQI